MIYAIIETRITISDVIEVALARKKIYEEIADIILSEIKSGKLNPGDKLPAIAKMAESYQVSQASIREALNSLKVLDVIHVKHGQGSFINEHMPLGFERSEEHTSELQSRGHLVCRLLLEKKKRNKRRVYE